MVFWGGSGPWGLTDRLTRVQKNTFIAGARQVQLTIEDSDHKGWLVAIKHDENNNPIASDARDWRPNGDRELIVEALDEF